MKNVVMLCVRTEEQWRDRDWVSMYVGCVIIMKKAFTRWDGLGIDTLNKWGN